MSIKVNWPKKRPWGWYATLIRTRFFCLKVLKFNPLSSLSLQRHRYRNELWFFVKGYGTKVHQMGVSKSKQFQFWYIRKGNWHQFRTFDHPVYVIEFQFGKYVSEIDIERV